VRFAVTKTGHVLFAGGSGVVGQPALRWFRDRFPHTPVLIGGRNLQAADELARRTGAAQAVAISLDKPGLGLPEGLEVAAVVMLLPDLGLHGLRYAQDKGVPYLSISNGLIEVGPEMALFAHRATAAPVVLASHWLAGAAVFLALSRAERFDRVESIRVQALIDEADAVGPSALEDMARLDGAGSAVLAFRNGQRTWLSGDATKGEMQTIDGRRLGTHAYSPFDVVSLYAHTSAPNIQFELATGASSSRLRGGGTSTEIVVEIDGSVQDQPLSIRSVLEFPQGQASLTGLSVVLALASALGLDGQPAAAAGLYLPELLPGANTFLDHISHAGAIISDRTGRA